MAFASANAALVDFANEADTNGERGLTSGDQITVDGRNMQLYAWQGLDINQPFDASPYLDAGNAGLGACKVLTATDQCNPGNDDNVTLGEAIRVDFYNAAFTDLEAVHIGGLVFRDAGHNLLGTPGNDGDVRIITYNNGGIVGDLTTTFSAFIAMANSLNPMFLTIDSIRFEFVNRQFYVSAMDVSDVPIPGALPLLLSGIAGPWGLLHARKKPPNSEYQ